MKVKLLYFSSIKDKIGKNSEILDIDEGSDVGILLAKLESLYPEIKDSLKNIMIAVNEEYADRKTKLKEGDVVALIPPVSGG